MKQIYFIIALIVSMKASAQLSPFIQVDQFGYGLYAEKVAVLSNPQVGYNSFLTYSPTSTILLKDSSTNQTVFANLIQDWNSGATEASSGDQGWWFDFSAYQVPGTYYVYDSVNNLKSAYFNISINPYSEVLKAAGRMYFYNRCNFAKSAPFADPKWTDAMSFKNSLQDSQCYPIYDTSNSTMLRDYSGGWFDAGDYNKYVTFCYSTIHNLLYAYEQNPLAFGDDWNLPESGNGVPDILDEIKWETDWLWKMVDSTGLTPIKMGSKNYADNTQSPPSSNFARRFYGPYCSSASISASSILAHTAIVMNQFPTLQSYADSLKFKSIQAYNLVKPLYFSNTLETNCDDGSIVSGDADVNAQEQFNRLLTSSVYLFELTGDTSYQNFIDNNYSNVIPYQNINYDTYTIEISDAFIRYAYNPSATVGVASQLKNSIQQTAQNNWNGYFGWNTQDLYRSFVPIWSYHWGSNTAIAGYASLNLSLAKYNLANDSASQKRKAAEQLHYFHGVNPNGMVYLSNMYSLGGDKCANEIYHTWFTDGSIYDNALISQNGPPPGYVVGGANKDFSVTTISPPSGQPAQKSYLDFNTGYPDNSWEITEPAIYSQAAYIRLLSNFVSNNSIPLGINQIQFYGLKYRAYNKLNWIVENENEIESYLIEKSRDGIHFDKLNEVPNTSSKTYVTFDNDPANGINYYRLSLKKTSHKIQLFSSLMIDNSNTTQSLTLYPNPASETLRIRSNELNSKSFQYSIYTSSNHLVLKNNVNIKNDEIVISTVSLTPGFYIISIEDHEGNIRTASFTKR